MALGTKFPRTSMMKILCLCSLRDLVLWSQKRRTKFQLVPDLALGISLGILIPLDSFLPLGCHLSLGIISSKQGTSLITTLFMILEEDSGYTKISPFSHLSSLVSACSQGVSLLQQHFPTLFFFFSFFHHIGIICLLNHLVLQFSTNIKQLL